MIDNEQIVTSTIELMKTWQKIEDASVKNTTEIIKRSDNPLIHIVMEIIRQDSVMHRRVQQLIIDHYDKNPIELNPEDLESIWNLIEDHNEIEKRTISMAEKSLTEIKSPVVAFMLEYLLNDEKKHDILLEEIEKIKKGDYPYNS